MAIVVGRYFVFKSLINKTMAYKCSQCNRVSDQSGNCPDCNIEMTEEKVEVIEEKKEEKESEIAA